MPQNAVRPHRLWYSLSRSSEMPERNTPQKTLESWKQIAAYLERSERTVRRCEAQGGLPVPRREHEKQDTVFAFKHEIEAWSRLRTKCSGVLLIDEVDNLRLPLTGTSSSTMRLLGECTATSQEHVQVMVISCALPFMRRQPSPATVREWSIRGRWNMCFSGSTKTVRLRTSILASHA